MILDTETENLKVLSLLSGLPHYIENENREKFIAYGGYILSYSTFSTIFMWTLCGPKIYHNIWKEQSDSIEDLRRMNPQDLVLTSLHADEVGQHMVDKFKSIMGDSANDVEHILHTMFG